MKYRSEIDGLRAIAVVPVILFHAGFELFSGGFVGVDVFFVISGYLITTIIINEMDKGKFSLLNFYERRARRILPALFFVVLCCIPAAWFLLLPSDMTDFSQSLVAVATFSSNILFWRESGYFANAAELKPLLHTWSLAVEEQFYILFPLFLMAAWRFGKRTIIWILIASFFASLAVAHWGAYNKPSATFYLLPTRSWELLIGSFAAFYLQRASVSTPHWLSNLLSTFGFGAILYSVFAFDDATPFPSLYALVPTGGTVLIILFSLRGTWTHTLLSLKSVVGVGLISYSLYLWHQPVFAFFRHYNFLEPTHTQMLIAAFVTFPLAVFTYYFVETPFRGKSASLNRRQVFSGSSVILGTLVAFGFAGHLKTGFPQRYENMRIWQELSDEKRPIHSCIVGFQTTELESCSFGPEGKGATILAIGDSHIDQWTDVLANIASDNQLHIEVIAKGACALAEVEYFYRNIGRNYEECTVWRDNLFAHIKETQPSLVLIQNSSLGYLGSGVSLSYWQEGLRSLFQNLEGVDRVIWVLDNPRFPFDVGTCVAKVLLQGYDETYCDAEREASMPSNLRGLEISTASEFQNVYILDLSEFFCNSDVCFGVRKQRPLMSDSNHISQYSAWQLEADLVEIIVPDGNHLPMID